MLEAATVDQLDEEELEDLRPAHFGVDTPVHRLVGIITHSTSTTARRSASDSARNLRDYLEDLLQSEH